MPSLEFMIITGRSVPGRQLEPSVSPELEHQVGWIELIADPPKDAADVGLRVDSVVCQ